MVHLQYADFFNEAEAATESPVVRNEQSADNLYLTVRGENVDLVVYGITDATETVAENWLILRVIDMKTFEMANGITAPGQYGIPLGAVGRVKIANNGGAVTCFGTFGN